MSNVKGNQSQTRDLKHEGNQLVRKLFVTILSPAVAAMILVALDGSSMIFYRVNIILHIRAQLKVICYHAYYSNPCQVSYKIKQFEVFQTQ